MVTKFPVNPTARWYAVLLNATTRWVGGVVHQIIAVIMQVLDYLVFVLGAGWYTVATLRLQAIVSLAAFLGKCSNSARGTA